jgi:uncharacterized protein
LTEVLIGAFALMLIFEGLLPFLSPQRWRAVFKKAQELNDGQLRFLGLTSMVIGVGLLVLFWN